MAKELYEFGPFQLDPAGRRLLRQGEPVAITPKAFDTLTALVLYREQPLNREDLIANNLQALFPGLTIVESFAGMGETSPP